LAEELAALRARGRFLDDSLLKLSCDAHMVMPYHRAIDRAREARAGRRAIGTTGFGIGPAYEDKMARVGLRFDELNNFARFREKLTRNLADKNAYLRAVLKAKPLKGPEIIDQMKRVRARMLPYLCDTGAYLAEAVAAGKSVLFEGAHGTMLDIDHGTYPFVT
jgi:adenylosuccinate synthase